MKPFPILIAVVTLCAAIGVISWMSQPRSAEPPVVDDAGRASANPFAIETTGPHPTATLAEDEYDFGSMILGETGTHAFVIRNEGEAPLKLHKGAVSCKCTVPTVPEDGIPPGESAEVVMEWTPLGASESFDKSAIIWTNDPAHEQLVLRITGEVRQLIDIQPSLPWTIGNVNEDGTSTFAGGIASGVDAFNVTGIESSQEWLAVEASPMTADELEHFGTGFSSGYFLNGTVRPEMPVGRFEAKLTVTTDVKDGHTIEIPVAGTRPGPFSILGQDWFGGEMTVRMGEVPATQGKSVSLSLFTERRDEPLAITAIEAVPDLVEVSLKRDESFTAPVKEKYMLTFRIPPQTRVGRYTNDKRIDMRILTNRESIPEINLSVDAVIQ